MGCMSGNREKLGLRLMFAKKICLRIRSLTKALKDKWRVYDFSRPQDEFKGIKSGYLTENIISQAFHRQEFLKTNSSQRISKRQLTS